MKVIKSISSYFQREKNFNKKLVKTLNSKMFKGYRITKEAKKIIVKKPKFIEDIYWESKTIDPFDDYYNIEYKKKNLSSLYKLDFSNMLNINNFIPYRNNSMQENNNKTSKLTQKLNVQIQKGESFRKRKITNLTKKPRNNNQYFYFCANSQLIKNNAEVNNKEKKEKLYRTIFQDEKEKELYNDIPIFAVDKLYKISNKNNKKYKYIKSKEERVNDLQFLYKLSHEKPKKNLDFRNKYNIKSAKTKNNLRKNEEIKNKSYNLNTKSSLNKSAQNKNNNFTIVNSSFKTINLNKNNKGNYSSIYKKKMFNEIGTQSQDSKLLFNSSSAGNIFVNKSNILNDEEIKNQINSRSNIFPIKKRIISDQIFKNQMQFKRWRFDKLKKLMES